MVGGVNRLPIQVGQLRGISIGIGMDAAYDPSETSRFMRNMKPKMRNIAIVVAAKRLFVPEFVTWTSKTSSSTS